MSAFLERFRSPQSQKDEPCDQWVSDQDPDILEFYLNDHHEHRNHRPAAPAPCPRRSRCREIRRLAVAQLSAAQEDNRRAQTRKSALRFIFSLRVAVGVVVASVGLYTFASAPQSTAESAPREEGQKALGEIGSSHYNATLIQWAKESILSNHVKFPETARFEKIQITPDPQGRRCYDIISGHVISNTAFNVPVRHHFTYCMVTGDITVEPGPQVLELQHSPG